MTDEGGTGSPPFASGVRLRPDRQHHLKDPRQCDRRKRAEPAKVPAMRSIVGKRVEGAEAAAIGRSRGGLTTKLHAVVDAISLPVHIHPTPGPYGDCPQAQALLSSLRGVGHVIADAAHDAGPLRDFIAGDLGAAAQIKANPSRAIAPPIDWRLYKERHQVECFNKLKRFRRSPRGMKRRFPPSGLRPPRLRHDLATLNANSSKNLPRRRPGSNV